ncbi:hypothetical protein A3SM_34500, partial [Pseudomonas syringae pv. actinidiae ICMP 18886]
MSLMELMQWSGHSSPSSTLHYIRIRPTKLAASFVKADQMSHMVSVLIDHDVIARRSSDPYTTIEWRVPAAILIFPKPVPE